MELISQIFLLIFWACMLAIFIGLFEPKVVLKGFLMPGETPTAGKVIKLYSMFGIIVLILWGIFSPSKESTADLAAKQIAAEQKAADDRKWNLIFAGQEMLKKMMRDPNSLVFDRVLYTDDESVCYEYRAKNGFGGMNKEAAVFSDKGLITNDDKGFDPIWSEKCAGKSGEDVSL